MHVSSVCFMNFREKSEPRITALCLTQCRCIILHVALKANTASRFLGVKDAEE